MTPEHGNGFATARGRWRQFYQQLAQNNCASTWSSFLSVWVCGPSHTRITYFHDYFRRSLIHDHSSANDGRQELASSSSSSAAPSSISISSQHIYTYFFHKFHYFSLSITTKLYNIIVLWALVCHILVQIEVHAFFFTFLPCILILSKFIIHQRMHKWLP
jgi:hypothetical protein